MAAVAATTQENNNLGVRLTLPPLPLPYILLRQSPKQTPRRETVPHEIPQGTMPGAGVCLMIRLMKNIIVL